ncbi:FMN reductase [Cellulomonas sp. APG4]|uniref:FMN reductase n=1 Tax=Cellulomonas sp. APG4 TaxID=1538656 RepID=UPI001379BE84|nr:FMN reductase [Cellulomonas sp. APG4]NCT89385.1 FMN reductase [Cellulomonas sp. APG4]
MSAPRRLVVVSAGMSQPSSTRLLADRLTEATVAALTSRSVPVEVTVVELREHAHDLTNMLLTGFATPELQRVLDATVAADGIVAVTPVYSGSYTGLFKTFFDVIDDGALAGVPTLIAATAGTPRHSLALEHAVRPLLSYLRAVTVPTAVFGATEDFGATAGRAASDGTPPLAARVDRAAEELAGLVAAREPRQVADPFADPTPFDQLLRGDT